MTETPRLLVEVYYGATTLQDHLGVSLLSSAYIYPMTHHSTPRYLPERNESIYP